MPEWFGFICLMSVYFYVGWQIGGLFAKVRLLEETTKQIIEKHNALVRVLTGRDEE